MDQRLTGNRTLPRFIFMLLDEEDRQLQDITASILGGDLTLSSDRLGGSGNLSLIDPGIDFGSHRLLISYDPGITGVDAWSLGVWLFASPKTTITATHIRTDVGLLSKLMVIEEASIAGVSEFSTQLQILSQVESLIRSTGETRLAVTPSPKTLSEPWALDAAQTLLTICNQALDAAGYWAVSVNGQGQYVLEPQPEPSRRPIVWVFTEDEISVIAPDQTDESDTASVPNQFLAYTTGSDDHAPLVGVATDQDPNSRFSTLSRGRVIEQRDQVEASSQDDINAIASRRLAGLQSPTSKRNVSHAMLPIWPRQVVQHIRRDGATAKFTINKLSFNLTFDAQMNAEWRQIK